MDFIEKIRELSARIPKQLDNIQTEEATKHALVMPFISALGYNVFDPTEVTPELCADVGTKKGEKVDYAILRDGKPIILFECKHHSADLRNAHASQLYRYFSVTEARFGVLTNGILYWFYTDLEASNKMDEKPFFEFNMLDIRESAVEELKKFSRSSFDLDFILNTAAELKYTREIRKRLMEQMQDPSDEFVRFFASQVYSGRMTHAVREQFSQLTRQAFKQLINDLITERLKTALASESADQPTQAEVPSPADQTATLSPESTAGGVGTTEDELEGYYIVRAVVSQSISPKRVALRDVQSYCGVLLDDNNRKPICRLHFNATQKYVSFFDKEKEERVQVEEVNDLYNHAERLRNAVARYEAKIAIQKAKGQEVSE
jgi:predicted type IV restriction endonuclease